MIKEKYEVKRVGFTLASTDEKLSSRFGLSALASLLDELKLDQQADRIFPKPGSNRAYSAGEMVHAWILMLHEGCDRLEDINQLKKERHLLARLGFSAIPDADTLGRWLKRHGELGSQVNPRDQSYSHLSNPQIIEYESCHLRPRCHCGACKKNRYEV